MVVTGAGPGIMAAGMEGAGREQSIGVNIRLPHEQGANAFIAQDPKLVEMRYFFTRKLMLIKESDGYVVLPGRLRHPGRGLRAADPAPDGQGRAGPGGHARRRPAAPTGRAGTASSRTRWRPGAGSRPTTVALYRITDDVEVAADELLGFYRNYHSCRWVGDLLVLRLQVAPDKAELADLNRRFADIVTGGVIRRTKPLPPERSDRDHLELARVALRFDRIHYGRLRQLIDALNECTGERCGRLERPRASGAVVEPVPAGGPPSSSTALSTAGGPG